MNDIIFFIVIAIIGVAAVRIGLDWLEKKIDEQKRQAYAKAQGQKGENEVNSVLSSLGKNYVLMKSILLPTKSGSTELDHVLVSNYGIFVIETKNYSGSVYGDEDSGKWIHTDRKGNERKMYSPIKQNEGHIGTLKRAINLDEKYFIPIVVFAGSAKLQIKSKSKVIKLDQLENTIKSYNSQVFTKAEVKKIVKDIKSVNMDSMMNRKKHIKHVKEKQKANQ